MVYFYILIIIGSVILLVDTLLLTNLETWKKDKVEYTEALKINPFVTILLTVFFTCIGLIIWPLVLIKWYRTLTKKKV